MIRMNPYTNMENNINIITNLFLFALSYPE
jgi:hypothetical protein